MYVLNLGGSSTNKILDGIILFEPRTMISILLFKYYILSESPPHIQKDQAVSRGVA